MVPTRVQTSVTLFGSPPWGFRLSGGKEYDQPLVITQVKPGSVGSKGGLAPGDVVIAVNGQFVHDMTQDQCEAKVRQAVGSLYMVLEKNAAHVSVRPSGQVNVQGDRNVYKEDISDLERLSRHNRCAKPFYASPASSTSPASFQVKEISSNPRTPPGFRSVSFRPKESHSIRNQPGGAFGEAADQRANSFNSIPKQFVSSYNSTKDRSPLPPVKHLNQSLPTRPSCESTRVM